MPSHLRVETMTPARVLLVAMLLSQVLMQRAAVTPVPIRHPVQTVAQMETALSLRPGRGRRWPFELEIAGADLSIFLLSFSY